MRHGRVGTERREMAITLTLNDREQEALDGIIHALEERLVNRMLEPEEWEEDIQLMRDRLDAAITDQESALDQHLNKWDVPQ